MKFDIIISINVHEKPDYLLNQIENINEYVSLNKKIILNCNNFMFEELKDRKIKNVIINPLPINKRRGHGSLTRGIVSNMNYAIQNYNFDYFLVMSSREFFYRELKNINDIEENVNSYKSKDYTLDSWHWPYYKESKLYKYLENNNLYYSSSAHEGMCFKYKTCKHIIDFFEENRDIMDDIFSFNHCVEEFALQSIAENFGGFYYIGNGVYEKSLNQIDERKFTYKIKR